MVCVSIHRFLCLLWLHKQFFQRNDKYLICQIRIGFFSTLIRLWVRSNDGKLSLWGIWNCTEVNAARQKNCRLQTISVHLFIKQIPTFPKLKTEHLCKEWMYTALVFRWHLLKSSRSWRVRADTVTVCVKLKLSLWQVISLFVSLCRVVDQCSASEKIAMIMSCQIPITGNSSPQLVVD